MQDFSEVIEELMEPKVSPYQQKIRAKPTTRECLLGCGKLVPDQKIIYKLIDGSTRQERVFVGYCTTCQSYLKDGEYHVKSKCNSKNPFSINLDKYNRLR